MARLRGPKSVQVSLNLPVLQISGTWEPNDDDRKAAWELYVELVTRMSVVPLGPDEGAAAPNPWARFGTAIPADIARALWKEDRPRLNDLANDL